LKKVVAAMCSILGGTLGVAHADESVASYAEQYRPQFHYSPPRQWMNDPNGMVYLDGEYHLFYQYNPDDIVWGPMHWGHAVSKDLVHWKNLTVALHPDANGTIFSGSAVADRANTSGLGAPGRPPLVAIFTSHDHALELAGSKVFQNQSLAYSIDKGHTWRKYAGNPVLRNSGERDFRDPKVSWFEPQKKWVMTLAVGDHVSFYSSKDLKTWKHESEFGREWGAHAGVWECPDLIAMVVDGEAVTKYVLLVSVNQPGGPNGGSATQYFIGDFDGHRFALDAHFKSRLQSSPAGRVASLAAWVDYGTDDYAGVTWSGLPASDGRHVFLGWMSNWIYAERVPTERWRSAMTLPRELKLIRTPRGIELHSRPIAELASLRSSSVRFGRSRDRSERDLTEGVHGRSGLLELELRLDTAAADVTTLEFANSDEQRVAFRINRRLRRYELDRSKSGAVDFHDRFADEQFAPMAGKGTVVSLRVFSDRSSIEIFINEGETVMTAIDFPSSPYTRVTLKADRPFDLYSGAVYELRSIWNGK
jgi:fructan beta-fructosidase